MKRQLGFSLIEILISVIIISIGVLGVVAMQGKTIQFVSDSTQRSTAAMLAADLIELIRSNRTGIVDSGAVVRAASNYYKTSGVAFTGAAVASCTTIAGCTPDEMATSHVALWLQQVRNSLPVDNATLSASYIICQDSTPATIGCDNVGSAIKIQIAWLSRNNVCDPGAPCLGRSIVPMDVKFIE
jgi:type IV pilus assembly protein PilV